MESRPNIIFIFSDQQRADTVTREVTPALYAYSEEGVRFTEAHTAQPLCGPARAVLQTGMYASDTGNEINGIPLGETRTLGKYFSDAGYETAYIGKWHLASEGLQYRDVPIPSGKICGYDFTLAADLPEFSSDGKRGVLWEADGTPHPFENGRVKAYTDHALEYISRPHDKPYFLMISYLEPHHQNTTGKFECEERVSEMFKTAPLPVDLKLKGNAPENYADYLGLCRTLDENLSRIVAAARAAGGKTVFVYSSDHGCHFMTRNSEYKRSPHSASTHIPMILFGDGVPHGKIYDAPVSLYDLPPTLLGLAGIPAPPEYRGSDLMPYVISRERAHDCLYIEISESLKGAAVVNERYIYAEKEFRGARVQWLLLDKAVDPAETENRLYDPVYSGVLRSMQAKLDAFIEETHYLKGARRENKFKRIFLCFFRRRHGK